MYIISYAGFGVKLILTTDAVKLEILSTKSETNSKCECSNGQNEGRGTERRLKKLAKFTAEIAETAERE